MEYNQELDRLRSIYSKLDISKPEILKAWFEKTKFLNAHDLMIIMGVSRSRLRIMRHSVGIIHRGGSPKHSKRALSPLVAPENWDNNWLASKYEYYSIEELARATGKAYFTIRYRLLKSGVILRKRGGTKTIPHKCANKQWLQYHYVTLNMSANSCAKLAGVSRTKLVKWLTDNNIPVRGRYYHQIPWQKKLIHKLKNHKEIRHILLKQHGIVAYYKSGNKDFYWFIPKEIKMGYKSWVLDDKNSAINKIPEIYPQFYDNDRYPDHWVIQRKDLEESTLLERRLALHTLVHKLHDRGWVQPSIPEEILLEDRDSLYGKERTTLDHYDLTSFTKFRKPGWRIILNYFDLKEELLLWWRAQRRIMRVVNALYKREKYDINTIDLFWVSCLTTVKHTNPNMYVDLFKRLNIKSILDLHPGYGSKAMAASTLGIKYHTLPNEKFDHAINKGFAEFLGLEHATYNGEQVDLVLSDKCLNYSETPELAFEYADKTKQLAVFVPKDLMKEYSEEYNPEHVFRVANKPGKKNRDYFFIW